MYDIVEPNATPCFLHANMSLCKGSAYNNEKTVKKFREFDHCLIYNFIKFILTVQKQEYSEI